MNERERIELLMKCYDLSSSQFADRTGIQRASVSHILSGRNKPSLEVMLKIYDAFPGLDMKWLMTGSGDAPKVADVLPKQPASSIPLFDTNEAVEHNDDSFTSFLSGSSDAVASNQPHAKKHQLVERAPRKQSQQRVATSQEVSVQKKIKEVRIFYTDGTYETLVPEK